jgi:hypothetical protein
MIFDNESFEFLEIDGKKRRQQLAVVAFSEVDPSSVELEVHKYSKKIGKLLVRQIEFVDVDDDRDYEYWLTDGLKFEERTRTNAYYDRFGGKRPYSDEVIETVEEALADVPKTIYVAETIDSEVGLEDADDIQRYKLRFFLEQVMYEVVSQEVDALKARKKSFKK